ncbi:UNVERIFIED_CONTAM: hypothetical protein Sradi_4895900 [Sesamum radiatum]|uniref:Uncharacterized protein n=2 Tax=Sesamum TaxID=4181 RepID=A0AAE2BLM7_9LAMI|nr:hypothetical protein Sango_2328200 [Sesamum angolense]
MSLINCLRKIDSEEELRRGGLNDVQDNMMHNFMIYLRKAERNWSGNLAPKVKPPQPSFRKMRSRSNFGTNKLRMMSPALHRVHSTSQAASYESAPATPRLVRSSGMRRDWSFEDLRRALEQ